MTLKIKHLSGQYYYIQYRYRWYQWYRSIRAYSTSFEDPALNAYLSASPKAFTLDDASAFVEKMTEAKLRDMIHQEVLAFTQKQKALAVALRTLRGRGYITTKE